MEKLNVPINVGDGPPVVVLHGFAMRPATYEGLVRLLDKLIVPAPEADA